MLKLSEDQLRRKEFIDNLFSMFEHFGNQGDRGFTMIINGKYGSGKSTLLGFLSEVNEQTKKFDIVNYNAWDNNLFDNPLIPILYEISKLKKKDKKFGAKIKSGVKKIANAIPKIITGTLANAHCIDLTSLTENQDTDIFEDYDKYRNAIAEFRKVLAESCKEKTVIFLVDELDRCLPEYQIKVLETLYHLFEIPNLIVVIALDKQQLECSIKNKFGDAQNTLGYLSKFINYQVDLPDESDSDFIHSLMQFACNDDYKTEYAQILIVKMLNLMNYSVRDCQRIVNEINLICNGVAPTNSIHRPKYWYPILIALIIIVKHSDDRIYKKWFYTEREDYYSRDIINYNDSPLNDFYNDVSNTSVEPLFSYLKNPGDNTDLCNNIAEAFFAHFINAFYPINLINENDLENELKVNVEAWKQDVYNRMQYPFSINQAIKAVKMLKL